jgi:hypothetical protein
MPLADMTGYGNSEEAGVYGKEREKRQSFGKNQTGGR